MASRLLLLGLSLLFTTCESVASVVAGEHARPNVILIFADDLGYGDLSCFNSNGPFKTPHLDKMAAEGARLTSFYAPTPYCAPSRGTILTGRYPFRHSVVRNPTPDAGLSDFGLPHAEITIAELVKSVGYATAAYGKWHLGHRAKWLPRTQGFDDYFGIPYSNDMYPVQLVHNEQVVEYPVVQASLTRRYTQRTLQFIEKHKEGPFFIYLPHAMPHKPLAVSDNFYTPETRGDLYADVMTELDWSVGQVLDKLKQLQLDRKTLVIFTSDNGPWFGGSTAGLRGMKGRTWEGGLRVPMIARFPGVIPPGIVNDQPAASIDILPTICHLVGVPVPDDRVVDGRDIIPLLKDADAKSPHDAIYAMQGKYLATIRAGKWKLHVRSPGKPMMSHLSPEEQANWVDPRGPDGVTILAPYEQYKPNQHPGATSGDPAKPMILFDLEADPAEQHDVADQHTEVIARLLAMFQKTQSTMPQWPEPKRSDLLQHPGKGKPVLMRLIGGQLRYDRIPKHQQHLLLEPQ